MAPEEGACYVAPFPDGRIKTQQRHAAAEVGEGPLRLSLRGEILLPAPSLDPGDPQHCTARPANLEVAPPSGHCVQ